MVSPIQNKEYGPNSTPQEIEALESCVFMHHDNVIYWKEVPMMSSWQVSVFENKIKHLASELGSFSILIDLTDSIPPNASVRKTLRELFMSLNNMGLQKAAAFTGKKVPN
ncbi:MAG: hypothetical protein WA981_01190 [Glaciecola sp.]